MNALLSIARGKGEHIVEMSSEDVTTHNNGMDTTARYGDKEDLETEVASLEMQKSTVADELNDLSDRKIASSILKGGGYPTKNDTEIVGEELVAENLSSAIVEIQMRIAGS